MKTQAVLLLGSNCCEKEQFIGLALEEISKKNQLVKKSAIYSSPSWGYSSENEFINIGLVVECASSAETLLNELLLIEKSLGRTRTKFQGYQDRCIDIDIILFGDQLIQKDNLIIPHPRMHKRRFCLVPLNEIIPNYFVPGLNKTINQLLSMCEDDSNVICLN